MRASGWAPSRPGCRGHPGCRPAGPNRWAPWGTRGRHAREDSQVFGSEVVMSDRGPKNRAKAAFFEKMRIGGTNRLQPSDQLKVAAQSEAPEAPVKASWRRRTRCAPARFAPPDAAGCLEKNLHRDPPPAVGLTSHNPLKHPHLHNLTRTKVRLTIWRPRADIKNTRSSARHRT